MKALPTLAFALLLALPSHAAETRTPLYTHTDSGPVKVMHGNTGEALPLTEAGGQVRDYVAGVNRLLSDESAGAEALSEALARGRELQDTLDTRLVGTLYLEEAVRRLKRRRLALVPVAKTDVYAAYHETYPERFGKRVYLRRGVDDLGIDYGTFAACLEIADFPSDTPPRKVQVEEDGAIWTRVNGQPLAFDIIGYGDERLMIRSVVIGATRSLGFKDKAQVTSFVVDSCV